MSSTARSNYYSQAETALSELDGETADRLFSELVAQIDEAFNKNQKEVASELQRIAREIEAEGKTDDSLRFKQRTCEIMLRRSMAERRRNQPAPEQNKESKSLNRFLIIGFVQDPQSYASFLQRTAQLKELRVLQDGSRWLRGSDSQLMLICRQGRLNGFYPLLVASSREDAAKQMQAMSQFIDGEEIDFCGIKLLVLKDRSGQRFLLGGSEIMQTY